MKIYCLNVVNLTKVPYEKLKLMVSEERGKKADGKKKLEDRYKCLYTELFLRYVFEDNGFCTENFKLFYNECGKPYYDKIKYFNISHSDEWIVIAIGATEIGVDIERIKEGRNRSLESIFKQSENDYINSFPQYEQCRYITQIWTLKESYVKYLGKSIIEELKNFSVDPLNKRIITKEGEPLLELKVGSMLFEEDYYLSFCSEETVTEMINVSIEDLHYMEPNS